MNYSPKNLQKPKLKKTAVSIKILGVSLDSTSYGEVLTLVNRRLENCRQTFIVTPNPEFLVFAQSNQWFKELLNSADLAIPDGVGLVWASRILGKPLRARLTGVDLMTKLCQRAAARGWTVFLLGGEKGVAQKALSKLQASFPGLKGWAESGPRLTLESWSRKEVARWQEKVAQKSPDLLFVALGMGKQEKFIAAIFKKIPVKLAMGVGGAFDYLAGKINRAPSWMRAFGLEWFYRLLREPKRWRRQLSLLKFIYLLTKERSSV
jgi:N-acetylglucosaminyldiphosphoundecaprenol N-acetyl-beta-D-mannosaminyltransferase